MQFPPISLAFGGACVQDEDSRGNSPGRCRHPVWRPQGDLVCQRPLRPVVRLRRSSSFSLPAVPRDSEGEAIFHAIVTESLKGNQRGQTGRITLESVRGANDLSDAATGAASGLGEKMLLRVVRVDFWGRAGLSPCTCNKQVRHRFMEIDALSAIRSNSPPI